MVEEGSGFEAISKMPSTYKTKPFEERQHHLEKFDE